MGAQRNGLRARPFCQRATNEDGLRCPRLARAVVAAKPARSSYWQDGRRARQYDDTALMPEIRGLVAGLPTYGYKRTRALLRRSHELTRICLERNLQENDVRRTLTNGIPLP